jgi:hypothetical protein
MISTVGFRSSARKMSEFANEMRLVVVPAFAGQVAPDGPPGYRKPPAQMVEPRQTTEDLRGKADVLLETALQMTAGYAKRRSECLHTNLSVYGMDERESASCTRPSGALAPAASDIRNRSMWTK